MPATIHNRYAAESFATGGVLSVPITAVGAGRTLVIVASVNDAAQPCTAGDENDADYGSPLHSYVSYGAFGDVFFWSRENINDAPTSVDFAFASAQNITYTIWEISGLAASAFIAALTNGSGFGAAFSASGTATEANECWLGFLEVDNDSTISGASGTTFTACQAAPNTYTGGADKADAGSAGANTLDATRTGNVNWLFGGIRLSTDTGPPVEDTGGLVVGSDASFVGEGFVGASDAASGAGVGSAAGVATAAATGASTHASAGTAAGVATAAATGAATHAAAGASAGAATASAVGVAIAEGVGASAGTATASATGAATAAGAGTAAGVATCIAAGESTHATAGASSGVATAAGVGAATAEAAGTSNGAATAAAVGEAVTAAAGSAAGSATAQATGASTHAAAGSSAGTATAQATGESTAAGAGSSSGAATAAATGAATAAGAGSSAGSAAAAAAGAALSEGAGTAAGAATASATGAATHEATGTAAGIATAEAEGAGGTGSFGTADGAAIVTGVGAALAAATGTADGVATAQAVGQALIDTIGSSAGTSTAAATGAATHAATGNAAGTATAAAEGIGFGLGAGQSDGVATAQAVGLGLGIGTGLAEGAATAQGVLEATAEGTGTAAGTSTAEAAAQGVRDATGTAAGVATAQATGVGWSGIRPINVGKAFVLRAPLQAFVHRPTVPRSTHVLRRGTPSAIAFSRVAPLGGAVTRTGVGLSSSMSTVLGVGLALMIGVGLSAGSSVALAEGTSDTSGAGTAVGAATAQAVGASVAAGAGLSVSSSSAQAEGVTNISSGTAAGSATAQAVGEALATAAGTAAGSSSAQATGQVVNPATGTAAGTSTAAAVGQPVLAGTGSSAGSATAAGVGASRHAATGSAAGTANGGAVSAALVQATGSASGVATVTGVANSSNITPSLAFEYVDSSGNFQTGTAALDGSTSITIPQDTLVWFSLIGSRSPVVTNDQEAWEEMGYRFNFGEAIGGNWTYPTAAPASKDEELGPPLFPRVFTTSGAKTVRCKLRDSTGDERTVQMTVNVTARGSITSISTGAGSWPAFSNGGVYGLAANGDYSPLGDIEILSGHNITIIKEGSGADPIISGLRLGAYGISQLDTLRDRPRNIRTVNVDVGEFFMGLVGPQHCGVVGGRCRTTNSEPHWYYYQFEAGTVNRRTNIYRPSGIFLHDTGEMNNTPFDPDYVMIFDLAKLNAAGVVFRRTGGSSTNHILRNTHRDSTYKHCNIYASTSTGHPVKTQGLGSEAYPADDRMGATGSVNFADVPNSRVAYWKVQFGRAGDTVPDYPIAFGPQNNDNPGQDEGVEYQALEDSVIYWPSRTVELGGRVLSVRNVKLNNGAGAQASVNTGYNSNNIPSGWNGPYLDESTNTRPVPTAF